MNSTAPGNSSLLFCNSPHDAKVAPSIVGLIVRPPLNIYVLHLIISRHLVTSELFALNETIFEILTWPFDILGLVIYVCPNPYVIRSRNFFQGFLITGRPFLLAVTCMERYVAVVKPLAFVVFKKCEVVFVWIAWLVTLLSCIAGVFWSSMFFNYLLAQITVCCVTKLYCCIVTLLALKRPGPGEAVRQRAGISSAKLKAFRIILTITVSLIMMYIPMFVAILFASYLSAEEMHHLWNLCYSCSLFSEFVQAFLFLQRSGKLLCVKWP